MADIDELRSSFYDDDAPRPLRARAPSSFVERAQNASEDDHATGLDVPMNVDYEISDLVLGREPNETELQQLLRLWQNERHAPEILYSQDGLLSRVLDQIRRQVGLRLVFRFPSSVA